MTNRTGLGSANDYHGNPVLAQYVENMTGEHRNMDLSPESQAVKFVTWGIKLKKTKKPWPKWIQICLKKKPTKQIRTGLNPSSLN